jgi:hypothetical protein
MIDEFCQFEDGRNPGAGLNVQSRDRQGAGAFRLDSKRNCARSLMMIAALYALVDQKMEMFSLITGVS